MMSVVTSLYTALLPGRPRLAAKMTGRKTPKYIDVRCEYSFSESDLRDHLNGQETYAVSLGLAGRARAGCRDYDAGDEAQALAAQRAATAMGLQTFIILICGRFHLWALFNQDVPIADIRCLLRKLPGGKGEIYPSGSRIRLPFGYHKIKRTRGVLVLPDGQRFDLDKGTQLKAAVAAVLTLPRNAPPPEAPEAERRAEAAWGEAYKPENWQTLPNGRALLKSPRLAKLAEIPQRAQLKTILQGDRVTLQREKADDDSDSAQVASLVFHLMRSQYPEPEVRAMALELREQLRPGRSLDHYRAHVDAEIERYRPKNYNPQPTMIVGINVVSSSSMPHQEANHTRKDRPQKVSGAAGYLTWLRMEADSETGALMLSVRQCAEKLTISESTVIRYERELKAANLIERRAYAQRQAGCIFVQLADRRGVIMPESATKSTPIDVVSSDPGLAQVDAENSDAPRIEKEHSPPIPPRPTSGASVLSSAAPTLRRAVRAAIAHCERATQRLDPETGQVRYGRIVLRDVRLLVCAELPDATDQDIKQAYDAEMARRRQAKKREQWDALRLTVRQYDNPQLLAALSGVASKLQRAQAKQSPFARKCEIELTILDEERRRRGFALSEETAPDRSFAGRRAGAKRLLELGRVLNKPPREHVEPPIITQFSLDLPEPPPPPKPTEAQTLIANLRERLAQPAALAMAAAV